MRPITLPNMLRRRVGSTVRLAAPRLAADDATASPPSPGVAPALPVGSAPAPRVGAQGRRLFEELRLFHGAKYPPYPILFRPGIKQVFLLAAIVYVAWTAAPIARRATGRSIARQLIDLLILGFRDGVDPVTYYLQELARPGGIAEARLYLTRYETKNGLFYWLNHMATGPYGRNEMNDKLLFAECCTRFGLAAPPVLMVVHGDAVTWRAPREAFERDLFCKLRQSSGSKGTLALAHVGPGRYSDPNGIERSLDEVVALLRGLSARKPILVQTRLANHTGIADLAREALVTLRVVTCLDETGRPEVTHGILRIMKKLEPEWAGHGGPDDEYGGPIDIATGRIGLLTGDKLGTHPFRFPRHPMTGREVTGRTVPDWPAVVALATRAHACFPHRVVIGWDIAVTDDGPAILEGNTNFDAMFFQRVYRRPCGRTRLGQLLAYHMDRLETTRRTAHG